MTTVHQTQAIAHRRRRRLSRENTVLLRSMILELLLERPRTRGELVRGTKATDGQVRRQVYSLSELGLAEATRMGDHALWSVTAAYRKDHAELMAIARQAAQAQAQQRSVAAQATGDQGTVPVVSVYTNPAWTLPTPAVTIENGVPVTRQAAPPPRFAVRLEPGTGVISLDNPQLARLAKPAARGGVSA